MSMAVMRVHKTGNYTVMSNFHFKEKGMSLKAKGLLSLMLSLPDDWDYSIVGLVKLSKDGKDSVISALKELEKFGYLTRTRTQDEKGKFTGYDYDIYEMPKAENPYAENPNTDNPNSENPTQLNTNESSTKALTPKESKEINDKEDKKDKRAKPLSEEFDDEFFPKPNWATRQLIKSRYIDADELYIKEYNEIMESITRDNGFEQARAVLRYFLDQFKMRKGKDENGNKIGSKLAYFETSVTEGIRRLNFEPSEEVKKLLGW